MEVLNWKVPLQGRPWAPPLVHNLQRCNALLLKALAGTSGIILSRMHVPLQLNLSCDVTYVACQWHMYFTIMPSEWSSASMFLWIQNMFILQSYIQQWRRCWQIVFFLQIQWALVCSSTIFFSTQHCIGEFTWPHTSWGSFYRVFNIIMVHVWEPCPNFSIFQKYWGRMVWGMWYLW
jgi:hypothetical protein